MTMSGTPAHRMSRSTSTRACKSAYRSLLVVPIDHPIAESLLVWDQAECCYLLVDLQQVQQEADGCCLRLSLVANTIQASHICNLQDVVQQWPSLCSAIVLLCCKGNRPTTARCKQTNVTVLLVKYSNDCLATEAESDKFPCSSLLIPQGRSIGPATGLVICICLQEKPGLKNAQDGKSNGLCSLQGLLRKQTFQGNP